MNLENEKVIDRVGNGKATKYQLKESQEMGIFKNKLYLRQLEDKLNKQNSSYFFTQKPCQKAN